MGSKAITLFPVFTWFCVPANVISYFERIIQITKDHQSKLVISEDQVTIWIIRALKTDCESTFLCSASRYRRGHCFVWRFPNSAARVYGKSCVKMEMSIERWWNGVCRGEPMYTFLGEKPVPAVCQVSLRIRRLFLFSIISPVLNNHPHINTSLIRRGRGWSPGAFTKNCVLFGYWGASYRKILSHAAFKALLTQTCHFLFTG